MPNQVSNAIYNAKRKRKVHRLSKLWENDPINPWVVLHHPLGVKSFRTWDEAMAYALSPFPYLMNAS